MSRDSQVSHIHLKNSHHVLYIANWVHDKLPFDGIDNPNLLQALDQEDQDITTSLPSAAFGSIKSMKKKEEPAWKDLDIYKLIDDEGQFTNERGYDDILKKVEKVNGINLGTFGPGISELDNGRSNSLGGMNPDDLADSSFFTNTSFGSNTSSNSSLPNLEIQATPDTRNRSSQRNTSNLHNFQTPGVYQTPIGRITR